MDNMPLQLVEAEQIDAHYAVLAELHNLVYPDYPKSIADWKRSDATREDKYLYKRTLLWHTEQKQFVGFGIYGHTHWAYHPDRYFLDVFIRPQQWGKGYGKYLYDIFYAELLEHHPQSIESECR